MANYTSSKTGAAIDAAVGEVESTGLGDSGLSGSGGNAAFSGTLAVTGAATAGAGVDLTVAGVTGFIRAADTGQGLVGATAGGFFVCSGLVAGDTRPINIGEASTTTSVNLKGVATTVEGTLAVTGAATFGGDVDPAVTETQDLGSLTFEWDNIFVQNAVTVSDEREKDDLGSADNYVPVMKLLDPRIFSRKSKVVKVAASETTRKVQATETVKEEQVRVEIIDGVPTRIVKTVDVEKPLTEKVQLREPDGTLVFEDVPEVLDEEGNVVEPARTEPVMVDVPVMIDEIVPAQDEVVVSHSRPHTGFMAQAVKAAMDEAGIEDWAGYFYDAETDTHGLRLQEFISPLLAYCQELESRLAALEAI